MKRIITKRNALPDTKYKWYLLGLSTISNAMVAAAPAMTMSVLLPEISEELNLSLVQAGAIWGLGAMPIVFFGLLSGVLGDRFGPKRVLIVSCILAAILGALRGLSTNFLSLSVMVFVYGSLTPMIILNNVKVIKTWFPPKELGVANGALSMGMALGFLIASITSATILSPHLGGWRQVFFFWGGLSFIFAIPWYFSRQAPEKLSQPQTSATNGSILAGVRQVARIRNIWLLGLAVMGISGAIQGLLGYLPLYLRGLGWTAARADSTLGAFHTISLLGVLPITLGSDRLGSRKQVLIVTGIFIFVGIGLLSFVEGNPIRIGVMTAGLVRDSFMALLTTTVIETPEVDLSKSGTALGFTMIFLGLGNLLAPPLGNSLAELSPSTPFIFWAAMSAFGIICIFLTREVRSTLSSTIALD